MCSDHIILKCLFQKENRSKTEVYWEISLSQTKLEDECIYSPVTAISWWLILHTYICFYLYHICISVSYCMFSPGVNREQRLVSVPELHISSLNFHLWMWLCCQKSTKKLRKSEKIWYAKYAHTYRSLLPWISQKKSWISRYSGFDLSFSVW